MIDICDNCENRKYCTIADEDNNEICEDFAPANYKDFQCVDCTHLTMYYDKQGWECCACSNEKGRGTCSEGETACSGFEITNEALKEYIERLKA